MAYSPTTWSTGDTITATLANHWETQYSNALADVQTQSNTFTQEQTFEGGVKVTTAGAAHSFTWQYNPTTNSFDLVYV